MKKPTIKLIRGGAIAILLLAVAGSATSDVDAGRLSAVTEKGMALWHVPGMSLAVVTSDEVLFQKGFGSTAASDGVPVDEHTLFAIASTTKAMVVAGILMLVDEEKLSLDDPVTKHIPELHFGDPTLTEQLNVRDLLAHRTGLPSTDFWSFFQAFPLEEQITRLQTVKPVAPVRSRLIYQNTMFEIAGLLIERLSGQRWDRFLTQRLWQPIGMMETYGARGQIANGQTHITPHFYVDGELTIAPWNFSAEFADAAGSAWSSIHDMSLWAQFLLRNGVTKDGERLISEEGIHQMFEPHQLSSPGDFYPTVAITKPNWRSYGLAWFQQDFQGRKIDFHTGSLSGMIALIGLDRAGDKAMIVLGNRDHAEMRHALLWEVMDNTSGDQRRDWNQEIFDLYEARADAGDEQWKETEKKRLRKTKLTLPLSAYPGTYRSASWGDVLIEKSGRDLVLKTSMVEFAMEHWHLDTFLVQYMDWQLRDFAMFEIGPDGSISSLGLFGETFVRVAQE